MSALNPSLLAAGLAFLSVPILILLIINRRRIVLYWAAYEWMLRAVEKKRRRLRITEILKLISKLLVILAAALLLGRVRLTVGERRKTLLVIDTTSSMGTHMGTQTRLERAVELAEQFISASDSPIAVSTFDGRLQPLCQFLDDSSAVLGQLQRVTLTTRQGTASEFLDALTAFPDFAATEAVVFISDFQRQWYGDHQALTDLQTRVGRLAAVTLIPVDTRPSLRNLGLSGYRLPAEGVYPGRQNDVFIRVENFSSAPQNRVPVTLHVGGSKADRALVSLGPGESEWVGLTFGLETGGDHRLTAELPADDYPSDNELFVHLAVPERVNVLSVAPIRARDEEFDRDLFLRSVLRAVGRPGLWNVKRILPQQMYQEGLTNYDLVVLFGVPLRQGDAYVPLLREYMALGRGVVSFGDCSQSDFWSGVDVAPAELHSTAHPVDSDRLTGTYLEFLGGEDLNPGSVHFFKFCSLQSTAADTQGRLYVAGVKAPLLLRVPSGDGVLLCAGFLPFPGYTDLYYNPNFVQFSMRLVSEALNRQVAHVRFGDEIATLRLPGLDAANRYSLAGGDAAAMPLQLHGDGRGSVLLGEQPRSTGFYTVLENGEPAIQVGYNSARGESAVESAGDALLATGDGEGAHADVTVMREPNAAAVASAREMAVALSVVLFLLLVLENYAHLVRKE